MRLRRRLRCNLRPRGLGRTRGTRPARRIRGTVTVQGVEIAKTLREKPSRRPGPARSFGLLGEGLRDSLPKTRGHVVHCPPEQLRGTRTIGPRLRGAGLRATPWWCAVVCLFAGVVRADAVELETSPEAYVRASRFELGLGLENDNKLFGLLYLLGEGIDGDDFGRTHGTRIEFTYRSASKIDWTFRARSDLFTQLNGNTPNIMDAEGRSLYRDAEGREGFFAGPSYVTTDGQLRPTREVRREGGQFRDANGEQVVFVPAAFVDAEGRLVEVDPGEDTFSVRDINRTAVWFHEITTLSVQAASAWRFPWLRWRAEGGLVISNRRSRSPAATGQQYAFHAVRNAILPRNIPQYDHQDDGGGVHAGLLATGGLDAAPQWRIKPWLAASLLGSGETVMRVIPGTLGFAGTYFGLTAGGALDIGRPKDFGMRLFRVSLTQQVNSFVALSRAELITDVGIVFRFKYADLAGSYRLYRGSPVNGFYRYNENNSTTDAVLRFHW